MAFHNPYHFVPVGKMANRNDELKREDLKNLNHNITHDRYVKDTFSGRIICRFIAETPFVVGAEQIKEDEALPAKVSQYTLDGLPAVPASTLRGLISGIAEAATDSAMRVLENKTYSFRKNPNQALKEIGMLIQKSEKQFYLLPLCEFFNRNPSYCLKIKISHPTDLQTFSFDNNRFYYLKKNAQQGTWEKPITETDHKILPPHKKNDYERGVVRIMESEINQTDFAQLGRKHELFIFCANGTEDFKQIDDSKLLEVSPEAVERFHKLAGLRNDESSDSALPYFPVGTNRSTDEKGRKVKLKSGDLVYFAAAKTGDKESVTEISFSCIWRGRVETEKNGEKQSATAHDFFSLKKENGIDEELLPFNKNRQFITLAERLFGFVEQNENKSDDKKLALAGRLYPSPAQFAGIKLDDGTWETISSLDSFYRLNEADTEGWTLLKILASPKLPSPALYFKNANGSGGYIAKKDLSPNKHQPQGRKFYLHHKSNEGEPWKTRKPDENLSQKMKVKPVRENSVFYFHLDFDNLDKTELGALLYALRPAKEFRHKIGMGKPLGLGQVKIEPVGVFLVNRIERYKSLDAPRYAQVWKVKQNADVYPFCENEIDLGGAPERYRREIDAAETGNSDIEKIYNDFRDSMNSVIRDALELIGDPAKVSAPVRYPTTATQTSDEGENFEWFVNNDNTSPKKRTLPLEKQFLKPLPNGKILPVLEENNLVNNEQRR